MPDSEARFAEPLDDLVSDAKAGISREDVMAFTTSLVEASRREAADSGHAFCLPLESIDLSCGLLPLDGSEYEDATSSGLLQSGFLSILKVVARS